MLDLTLWFNCYNNELVLQTVQPEIFITITICNNKNLWLHSLQHQSWKGPNIRLNVYKRLRKNDKNLKFIYKDEFYKHKYQISFNYFNILH